MRLSFCKNYYYFKCFLLLCVCSLMIGYVSAQSNKNKRVKKKSVSQKTVVKSKPQPLPLNLSVNRIENQQLPLFYSKLQQLQVEKSSVVRIVQIGDSHIQANFISEVLRTGFQQEFGDAGRGLVFPFQVARTNSASDIKSWGSTGWKVTRLVQSGTYTENGLAGFSLKNSLPGANFTMQLSNVSDNLNQFKIIKLITDSSSSWELTTIPEQPIFLSPVDIDSATKTYRILLNDSSSQFNIKSIDTNPNATFYGAIVETGLPGIIFNNIGVNGAKYEQYNLAELFWKQLPILDADLYIISLGTNEAQTANYDESLFLKSVDQFVNSIKSISPNAEILITTAIDSYKKGRPNKELQLLNQSLVRYCKQNNIALWDAYRITLGYGAARHWLRKGLLSKDKVHFTKEGYQLQGNLLLQCLLKRFQNSNVEN